MRLFYRLLHRKSIGIRGGIRLTERAGFRFNWAGSVQLRLYHRVHCLFDWGFFGFLFSYFGLRGAHILPSLSQGNGGNLRNVFSRPCFCFLAYGKRKEARVYGSRYDSGDISIV